MKHYRILFVFALLFLAACSGGVETGTILDSGNAPSFKDTKSADGVLIIETMQPTDTTLPTVKSTEIHISAPIAERDLDIITLLPKDAIPAIDNPIFISTVEADLQYEPDELVIGVQFDGEARAYSIPLLSSHEIVNDTVGGRKIAVTW